MKTGLASLAEPRASIRAERVRQRDFCHLARVFGFFRRPVSKGQSESMGSQVVASDSPEHHEHRHCRKRLALLRPWENIDRVLPNLGLQQLGSRRDRWHVMSLARLHALSRNGPEVASCLINSAKKVPSCANGNAEWCSTFLSFAGFGGSSFTPPLRRRSCRRTVLRAAETSPCFSSNWMAARWRFRASLMAPRCGSQPSLGHLRFCETAQMITPTTTTSRIGTQ